MELIVRVVLINDLDDIELFSATITKSNYKIARKNQELQLKKIILILKEMKEQGIIKSVNKPKNKKIQGKLNQLVELKKIIKQTINNISEMFYK